VRGGRAGSPHPALRNRGDGILESATPLIEMEQMHFKKCCNICLFKRTYYETTVVFRKRGFSDRLICKCALSSACRLCSAEAKLVRHQRICVTGARFCGNCDFNPIAAFRIFLVLFPISWHLRESRIRPDRAALNDNSVAPERSIACKRRDSSSLHFVPRRHCNAP
jgi:hypothetical protein